MDSPVCWSVGVASVCRRCDSNMRITPWTDDVSSEESPVDTCMHCVCVCGGRGQRCVGVVGGRQRGRVYLHMLIVISYFVS